MQENKVLDYIKNVLLNRPNDWLNLTTHRLDIYNEEKAKIEFLNEFEILFNNQNSSNKALQNLSTAYDYIRLGHPLSCILEWTIASLNYINSENVICFSSKTIPVLAILRTNLLLKKQTRILYTNNIRDYLDVDVIKNVYGYEFETQKIENLNAVSSFDGSTIFIEEKNNISSFDMEGNIDFFINFNSQLGSILCVKGNEKYISEIQHVRRRETIAMTPHNCLNALESLLNISTSNILNSDFGLSKNIVLKTIKEITKTKIEPFVASSGLSIQYAIMMGLIQDAQENHKEKKIKFIVPPNCYGGTNDQARRVAACLKNVEILDLPVDGKHNMVENLNTILTKLAKEDAIPYIIAEIPTNPRVEIPNLVDLKNVLSQKRKTKTGKYAIDPVFILDQTFCPNVNFLGDNAILSSVRAISYASGSKFPSGGKCTAGYCVGNSKTQALMDKIKIQLQLCDNEATHQQIKILAEQLPSMNQRIVDAYKNTRNFVNFIKENLPNAKINFVSEELAEMGFTPSVFSLDLPTKGSSEEEKETYKRVLNLKLIDLMISEIPYESKFCVSYGQLKGCYWTIPATSTQGTTKEGDKDYIIRASISPNLNLELHKEVFSKFVNQII